MSNYLQSWQRINQAQVLSISPLGSFAFGCIQFAPTHITDAALVGGLSLIPHTLTLITHIDRMVTGEVLRYAVEVVVVFVLQLPIRAHTHFNIA